MWNVTIEPWKALFHRLLTRTSALRVSKPVRLVSSPSFPSRTLEKLWLRRYSVWRLRVCNIKFCFGWVFPNDVWTHALGRCSVSPGFEGKSHFFDKCFVTGALQSWGGKASISVLVHLLFCVCVLCFSKPLLSLRCLVLIAPTPPRCIIKLLLLFCLSVRPSFRSSAWNNSAPTRMICTKFDIWYLFENMLKKLICSWKN
jgi:hypothetical protein